MFFTQNLNNKFFIRSSEGEITLGSDFLKNILHKYDNFLFSEEINSSALLKIDCFLDSILIETQNFFLIEKIFQNSPASLPEPYNLFDNLFTKENYMTDYWYDEKNKKILSCFLRKNNNNFSLLIRESSLSSGQTSTILQETLNITNFPNSWIWDEISLNSVKITYNKDTRIYNISFLVKTTENWGIISVFLYEDPSLKIKESNGVFLS